MTDRNPIMRGGCQCGATRYALYAAPTRASICHCRMCQKASGNYFMALTGVKRDEFAWTKNKPGTFRSSELVERDFCPKCGTPLTYRALDLDRISVSIGSLDDPSSIHLEQQYGTESAAVDLVEMAKLPGVRTDQWATPERLARRADDQHGNACAFRWLTMWTPPSV
jgi:hypothetical protein